MQCPKCGATASEGAHFCATDGTPLVPATTPGIVAGGCRCGAGPEEIDDQGFCNVCGRRCGTQPRDHTEISVSAQFGGVTDKGRRHARNDDDMALAVTAIDGDPVTILIVCDGVSTSTSADSASTTAAQTTRNALGEAIQSGAF